MVLNERTEKEKRCRGQPPLKGCQLTNGDGRKWNPLDGDLLDGRDDRVPRPRLEAVVDDVDGGADAAEHDREPKQFGDPGTSISKLFLLSLLQLYLIYGKSLMQDSHQTNLHCCYYAV